MSTESVKRKDLDAHIKQELSDFDQLLKKSKGILRNPCVGLPPGNYKLVGWDLDTTGCLFVDEIYHVYGYTPNEQYSEYIMPYHSLRANVSRKQHLVITRRGRYRVLKDTRTHTLIKTKPVNIALADFLQWLERIRADTDGIILTCYHRVFYTTQSKLIDAYRQVNLFERFQRTVKGFCNGYVVAQLEYKEIPKTYGIRYMSLKLLDLKHLDFHNAEDRAYASYYLVCYFTEQRAQQNLTVEELAKMAADLKTYILPWDQFTKGTEKKLIDFVVKFTNPVDVEERKVAELKELLAKQHTYRAIFGPLMKDRCRNERVFAGYLRSLLINSGITFELLKETYSISGRDGLAQIFQEYIKDEHAEEDELEELLYIVDCYFDPQQRAVTPKHRHPPEKQPVSRDAFFRKLRIKAEQKLAAEEAARLQEEQKAMRAQPGSSRDTRGRKKKVKR